MTLYFVLKWIHILSATVLMGTGAGIAFFMWMAHRSRDVATIAATSRLVVLADAIFTAPAVLVQFVSGLWLAHLMGMPLPTTWIKYSLVLFLFVGACWLPVLWLQYRARQLSAQAQATQAHLPPTYFRIMRIWFWLGWPAFISVVAIIWLMVAKPA